ncbi:MAG: rod shape-determining protein RodA [Magnetovibrionaceae bacterium]
MAHTELNKTELTLGQKVWQIHWFLVLLITATAGVGFVMLYSAANGSIDPWASRQAARFAVGLVLMLCVAVIDIRIWLKHAYLMYGVSVALLCAVEFSGFVGMGAQRWISLGFFNLQPSELTKITLVLALARYFHATSLEEAGRIGRVVPPVFLIALPVALVLRQPDLGTALMMAMASAVILFLAGVRLWKFGLAGAVVLGAAPVAWSFLHDYQKQRVLTFLDPERDALGAGYHIIQSKIALGSGGIMGKGFLQGTQGHLNFLPEKQTDFIFTMLAEEFGLLGGLGLLGLYALLLAYGFFIALRSRNHFGRLVAMGVTTTFFLYVFINIAMVMGLIPVVGVPLPLISYGGTVMMTLLIGFGLLLNVWVHRDVTFGPRGAPETS